MEKMDTEVGKNKNERVRQFKNEWLMEMNEAMKERRMPKMKKI